MQSGARLSKPKPKPEPVIQPEVKVEEPVKEEIPVAKAVAESKVEQVEVKKEEPKTEITVNVGPEFSDTTDSEVDKAISTPEVKVEVVSSEAESPKPLNELPPLPVEETEQVVEPDMKIEEASKEELPPEPRVAKEKFILPPLEEAKAIKPARKIKTKASKQIIAEKPAEKIEVELPVLSEIRPIEEDIASAAAKFKDKSFKVNFKMPKFNLPKFPKIERPAGFSSPRLLVLGITLVIVGIVGSLVALMYIDSQPSTGKALSAVRETLANIQTLNFTLSSGFDLTSIPTTEGAAQGAKETELIMVYKATGKYDKVAREMEIDGEYQSFGESLTYKQILIANDTYIKYAGRDYIKGDADDAILTISNIESHNLFPRLDASTRFGFGAEETIGGVNTYRFRAYPTQDLLTGYANNFIADIIKKLYPLNPPDISTQDTTVTDAEYRIWVAKENYQPVKIQILFDKVQIDLGERGIIDISEFQAELLFSGVNQPMSVESPI